ncbi:DUF1127 domain-containing protein [Kosakonia sp. BYX6]|uniref:DUF1127 domain-containing protein n=1 Tax=Kosakonia calanthes TaxID=3139408 RepID=A0ABZ3B5M7_9ENTR
MGFYENRHNRPFFGFTLFWRNLKHLYERWKTRRLLRGLNDEQLKDLGIRRDELW